ncbi:MAG: PaaI family thioesterase [Pseudomonadota bacterium]
MTTAPDQAVRQLMSSDKQLLSMFGIDLVDVEEGLARLSLRVTGSMVNSQSFCHGGIMFSLADTASAYACASRGVNPATIDAQISYLQPARLDDIVFATARVLRPSTKVLHVETAVERNSGESLARYRGTFYNRGALAPAT